MKSLFNAEFFWRCSTCGYEVDMEESENAPVCNFCGSLLKFSISFDELKDKEDL